MVSGFLSDDILFLDPCSLLYSFPTTDLLLANANDSFPVDDELPAYDSSPANDSLPAKDAGQTGESRIHGP